MHLLIGVPLEARAEPERHRLRRAPQVRRRDHGGVPVQEPRDVGGPGRVGREALEDVVELARLLEALVVERAVVEHRAVVQAEEERRLPHERGHGLEGHEDLRADVEDEVPLGLAVADEDDAFSLDVFGERHERGVRPALFFPLLVAAHDHHRRAARVERELA